MLYAWPEAYSSKLTPDNSWGSAALCVAGVVTGLMQLTARTRRESGALLLAFLGGACAAYALLVSAILLLTVVFMATYSTGAWNFDVGTLYNVLGALFAGGLPLICAGAALIVRRAPGG